MKERGDLRLEAAKKEKEKEYREKVEREKRRRRRRDWRILIGGRRRWRMGRTMNDRLDYFRMNDTVSSYLSKHAMIAVISYLVNIERDLDLIFVSP